MPSTEYTLLQDGNGTPRLWPVPDDKYGEGKYGQAQKQRLRCTHLPPPSPFRWMTERWENIEEPDLRDRTEESPASVAQPPELVGPQPPARRPWWGATSSLKAVVAVTPDSTALGQRCTLMETFGQTEFAQEN